MKTINFIEALQLKRISGAYLVKIETDADRLSGKIFQCGTDF
jgi:hypothetical protein